MQVFQFSLLNIDLIYIWGQIIYKDQGHIDWFYQISMQAFNKENTNTNVPVRF